MGKGKKIRYRRYISKQGLTFLLSGERQFARVAMTVMIMFIMLLTLPAFASSPEVIPYSGALRIERSDIVFEGSHPPLEFSRYFNSNSLVPGSMGTGWSHNYQYHLVIKDNKKEIFVLEPDNSINIFRQVKDSNTYYSTSGRGRFFRGRDGLKLILPQRDELYFDSTGKLTEFRNSYKQTIKFTYTNGRLTRVSGSFGQFIEFSYNKYGRVILASSSKEDRIEYSYDVKGHLSGVKKNGEALERYLVDTEGNITDFHLINKGLSWKFTYNRSGQIKTFTNPFQYVLRYEYEQTPEFTAFHLISPDGGKTTHKHFLDNSKNVVIDPEGGKKITEFDPETGLLKKIIDPNQNVTEYRWDEQKRLVELIDPMGGQTKIEYLKDIPFPVKLHTPDRNVIKMTYDNFYNLIKVDSKNHGTQVFKYDKKGRQVYKKDYNGSVMKFEYLSGWLPTSISDDSEKLVELEYDKNGQLSYFKWAGREKKISFNEMIHKAEKELGLTQKPVYDLSDAGKILLSHDRLSEYTFDKTANITMIKFPGGSIRKFEYDLNGQLKKVVQDDKVFETIQYDPAGNVISKSYGDDKEARFTYDPFNRLIKAVHPNDSIIAYSYSHSGNVATSRYNHVSMQFSHNKQGLIETIRLTAGKGALGDVQYSYSKKGRLTGISALGHDLALKRDSNGLISVIDSPAFGQAVRE